MRSNVHFSRQHQPVLVLIALILTLTAGLAPIVAGAQYSYSNVLDSTGQYNIYQPANLTSEGPTINGPGGVAFSTSAYSGGANILIANPGAAPVSVISTTSGVLEGFAEENNVSINDSGTIAFHGNFTNGNSAIFTDGIGKSLYTVDTAGFPTGYGFFPSINNSGSVAYEKDTNNLPTFQFMFLGLGLLEPK